jgi:hypothetical protein
MPELCSFKHPSSILYVSTSTSRWQLLGSSEAALPPHHRDSLQINILFLCLPCPQVFKHNNNLNEIMRETHSNAAEGTVLLLRHQRELN